ncbi:MAG TPA: methyltransferase domain-containing protein [Gemmatimonadales bacterium]|nr:methyltransferase domain-containing protein [Gemmatimonadales bacterium]
MTARLFAALLLAQALHSIEEYRGRLWETFPPAHFVSGLASNDRERGFLLLNIALVAFGFWCLLWPVRRGWPSAVAIMSGWAVVEMINGVGHPLWALRQGSYTPGVVTAPLLFMIGVALLVQLRAPAVIQHLLGKGIFPEQLAWFLEGWWRRLILSPATLRARLPLTDRAVVCEIGVGGGYYGCALAPFAARYVGLDIQPGMLRRVARRRGNRVLPVQGDATRLPLAAESVDLVVAVTVIGEVSSVPDGLNEVWRVLRPGGTLSISEHFPDPDRIALADLRALVERAGLRFERHEGRSWSYTATFKKPRGKT